MLMGTRTITTDLRIAARLLLMAALFSVFAASAPAQSETDPARIFNAAQDAHERGQVRDAIVLYKRALELFPKFPEAEFQMGNAYRQIGEVDNAEECYRRALEIRRNWTLPMVSLASIRVAKGDLTEAENLVQDAIGLGGENSAAYAVLTEVVVRRNASTDEMRNVLQAVRDVNSRPKPQTFLLVSQAMLERRIGDAKAAAATVANALRLDPNNTGAISESIELALGARDSDTALAQALKLERLTNGSDDSLFYLARAYAATGENEKALQKIEAMKVKSALVEDLRKDLNVVASRDPVELEKLLVQNPSDNLVIGRLCVLFRTSNPSKAVDYCRRILQTDPSNVTLATRYAAALVQAQKFQEALALLLQLKEAAPDNYTVRANLATVYFQMKRWDEAKPEYKWLQERQPSNAMTYYFLGIVHDRLSEYIAALGQYQQFLALADTKINQLEIEKVNLRLPTLKNQIKEKKGK